jgi:hypothetical protein
MGLAPETFTYIDKLPLLAKCLKAEHLGSWSKGNIYRATPSATRDLVFLWSDPKDHPQLVASYDKQIVLETYCNESLHEIISSLCVYDNHTLHFEC